MGARRAVSLIEVLVIAMVLGVVAIPFLEGFGSFSRSMHRTTRHTGAIYLAQAIMEQIRHRLERSRDPAAAVLALAEAGAPVVTADGAASSRYFLRFENLEGTGLHGVTRETDPDLFTQLSVYSCEVQVLTGPEVSLPREAGGDGLVEVGVTVRWQAPVGDGRSVTLWSMLTSPRARGGP